MKENPYSKHIFEKLSNEFANKFGNSHQYLSFAPGRANLIGEHTDYNDGFVLPFAIQQGIWFYASPNQNNWIHIISYDERNEAIFSMEGEHSSTIGWTKFAHQVIKLLKGELKVGVDILFGGDLPIGGGVSSSSALTCGLIDVLVKSQLSDISPDRIVKLAVQAEHGTGVEGGIMDQFTIVNGKKGNAILLDCKDWSSQYVSMPTDNFFIYLVNTNVKHNLIETDYNLRRKECDTAVEMIKEWMPEINSIRDLNLNDLVNIENILPDLHFRRVRHVVSENNRVNSFVSSLNLKEYERMGILLNESHDSLRNDYEVSCEELDWQVDYAKQFDFNLGGRMMGGGFGGCSIHLSNQLWQPDFIEQWVEHYSIRFGQRSEIIPIYASNGILNQKLNDVF